MRTSALFGTKNFGFLKFMVCPHGQEGGGIEPVRTFCGQVGSIFCNFVRTSFMDGPLYVILQIMYEKHSIAEKKFCKFINIVKKY